MLVGTKSHLQKLGRTNQLTRYIPVLRFARIARLGVRKEFLYKCILAELLGCFITLCSTEDRSLRELSSDCYGFRIVNICDYMSASSFHYT